MSDEQEDVKPKLNLNIVHQGNSITVKVKANTKFEKIFKAASQRFGKEEGTFKFHFGNTRLQPQDTPADHDMEDGDQIDAFLEMIGGAKPSL